MVPLAVLASGVENRSLRAASLNFHAHGATELHRVRLLNTDHNAIYSALSKPDLRDIRGQCLDGESLDRGNVSHDFLNHYLIVYAVGNVVGSSRFREVGEELEVDYNVPWLLALTSMDTEDPPYYQVFDQNLIQFHGPRQ